MIENHLGLFKWTYKMCEIYYCFAYRWDHARKRMRPGNAKTKRNQRFCSYLHNLILVLYTMQGVHHYMMRDNSAEMETSKGIQTALEYIVGYTAISYNCASRNIIRNKESEIALFLNWIFHTTEQNKLNGGTYTRGHQPLIVRLNLFVAYYNFAAAALLPFGFAFGLHLRQPCKASFFGYWLLPECQGKMVSPSTMMAIWMFLFKLVLFVINYFIAAFTICTAGYGVAILQTMSTLTARDFLKRLQHMIQNKEASPKSIVLVYRNIQLLIKLFNEIQQRGHMTVITIECVVCQAVCLAAFLRLPMNMDNIAGICTFGGLYILCLVVVIGMQFTGMATIYSESKLAHQYIKESLKTSSRHHRRYMERFLRSFPYIKMGLGDINFIEEMTPLNCIDFANDISVNILLLSNN